MEGQVWFFVFVVFLTVFLAETVFFQYCKFWVKNLSDMEKGTRKKQF